MDTASNETPCRHMEPAVFPVGISEIRSGVLTVSWHSAGARLSFVGIRLGSAIVSRAYVGPIFVDIAPFPVANVFFLALICLFPHKVMWTPQAFFG